MRKLALAAVFALCPAVLFGQQMLVLRDGRTMSGTFISGDSGSVVFRSDDGVRHRFNIREVQSLRFNQSNAYLGSQSGYYGSNTGNYPYQANREQRGAYLGNTVVIPTGTQVSVRTDQTIDSQVASVGQTFPAQIANDVTDNSGMVVIPRGSPAQLVIRQVSTGGGITGTSTLELDLASVTVNGRPYMVSSESVRESGRQGIGANRRTAEMMGGGAALGTLIGAIAGGGTGAAIGAAVGAAAGGTTQVLTKGNQVRVPAETVLNFQLDQPLRLTRQQTY
jgi:hypothetical protein